MDPIDNELTLAQIMTRSRISDEPLSDLNMTWLLAYICVTWPRSFKNKPSHFVVGEKRELKELIFKAPFY